MKIKEGIIFFIFLLSAMSMDSKNPVLPAISCLISILVLYKMGIAYESEEGND